MQLKHVGVLVLVTDSQALLMHVGVLVLVTDSQALLMPTCDCCDRVTTNSINLSTKRASQIQLT